MLKYLPLPDVNVVERQHQLQRASAEINNIRRRSTSGKVEHKFTDKVSLTGFYL